MKLFPLILLLGALALSEVRGYGSGAPSAKEICQNMIPKHGADPQTSPSPYKVALSNLSPMGGDSVKITLSAPTGESFKGFLVMVKKAGDGSKAFGSFKSDSSPDAKAIGCFGGKDSAMTHNSNSPKSSLVLEWIAPNEEDLSNLEVVTSFVKSASEYWTSISHPEKLIVKRNAQATTLAPLQTIGDEVRVKLKAEYSGCDVKGCLGFPDGCIDTFLSTQDSPQPQTCAIFLTWQDKGGRFLYSLVGRGDNNGYLAMGFSEDKTMGKDSVAACHLENGSPTVNRFYNTGQSSPTKNTANVGIKEIIEKTIVENYLFCSFEQVDHEIEGLNIKVSSDPYYILLARGSGATGALSYHETSRVASEQKFYISDVGIFGASSSRLLFQLHGAFMIVAWLLCAPTGMFTARYYKLTQTAKQPFNKAFWFVLHLFCMFSTVFLTACGAVFIIVKKSGFQFEANDKLMWHPVLGVILFGLAIFQVLLAFLRPHPGTSRRPIFNWIHWTIGNSAHIVGIACIFLANDLGAANLGKDEYMFIMMGAVLFHIVMHLIMSFHTLWADKQMDFKGKRAVVPGPMKSNGLSSEAPGSGFRMVMLFLYFVGLFGCAVALLYYVFKPLSVDIEVES